MKIESNPNPNPAWTNSGEHQKNTQNIATIVGRLESNKRIILENTAAFEAATADAEIKALEFEIARRKHLAANDGSMDGFDLDPVCDYAAPCSCPSRYEEAIDKLSLLDGETVQEGYVTRGLLVPVKEWVAKENKTSPIWVSIGDGGAAW